MENNDTIFSDIERAETEAPFFKRFFANLIDWIIEFGLLFIFYIFTPRSIVLAIMDADSFLRFIVIFLVFITYRFVCLLLFHKTIGMMLLRIKFLNSNLQPLSALQKITAAIAPKVSDIRMYNGQ
ncbi:hypothetical protein ESA94_07955 [Lacibacter luteus]|uniref:RDD domain-containing protein n=1 Tax=Lacibacter luteus TaxID=2508719 RepID=A0A4V1M7K5_9BACT|nr:RDD family protein [Lacibacter luteus]RXK60395.1 hypothetical protein ESA94_07955 [Lacibacter luteus]